MLQPPQVKPGRFGPSRSSRPPRNNAAQPTTGGQGDRWAAVRLRFCECIAGLVQLDSMWTRLRSAGVCPACEVAQANHLLVVIAVGRTGADCRSPRPTTTQQPSTPDPVGTLWRTESLASAARVARRHRPFGCCCSNTNTHETQPPVPAGLFNSGQRSWSLDGTPGVLRRAAQHCDHPRG